MQITTLSHAPGYDADRLVAVELLRAGQCSARLIRLSPGQALPPHTHGASDLVLYVVEGTGEIDTPDGPTPFGAGSVAQLEGAEELRVRNAGDDGLTLLAFLAPAFPPAAS